MRVLNDRIQYLLGASLLALGLGWALRPSLASHGLHAAYSTGGHDRIEQVALLTSNDTAFDSAVPLTVKWTGYLFQPHAGEIHFRIPSATGARLVLGSDVIFDTLQRPSPGEEATAYPAAGFTPIAFELALPRSPSTYIQAGLEWDNPLRWQVVPAAYLFPSQSNPVAAEQTLQQSVASSALLWIGAGLALALIINLLYQRLEQLRSRSTLGILAIVVLALALRLAFLHDATSQPGADVLAMGSDQRSYQANALEYLRGYWPPNSPFYVQPGMSLWLGWLYSMFGPSMRLAQIIQMGLGAAAAALVYWLARQAGGELAGWIAGLLWAIFPLPIFYEAQLLTHGLEPVLGLALVCLWGQACGGPGRAGWIAGLGLALGVSALLRPTFLILAPFMALSVLWANRPRWPAMVGWPVALAVFTCLPIAPITWHNYQANHAFQLLTSNSDVTLYLGNNRDSTGLGEYSPAFLATHTLVRQGKTTYLGQTLADIRADPARWGRLMLRKSALYLGDPELPNNVDFHLEGTAISPVLGALPLRFGAMLALALAGLAIGFRPGAPNRGWNGLLGLYLLTQFGATVAYHVFSRFRAPVYAILPVLAGCGLAFLISAVLDRAWRRLGGCLAIFALSGAVVWVMPASAEAVMTRPTVGSLPADSIRLDSPISDSLVLAGYDRLSAAAPEDPVFITLYWQARQPLDKDYYVTVQLFSGDQKVVQADQEIGTGSFPDFPTSQWQPGQTIRDTLYMEIPSDAPAPAGLSLLVAVYDRASGQRLGETRFGLLPVTRLAAVTIPKDAVNVGAKVGTATLSAYAIQKDGLTFYWQSGGPMAEDAIVFVHLLDSQGKFLAGTDARPMNGQYSTQAWQPGDSLSDFHPWPSGLGPGSYTLTVGMYDSTTQGRLPVVDSGGNGVTNDELVLGTVKRP